MNIEELMNNPEFKIDLATFLIQVKRENLINSYYSKAILKRQIELLQLQKGKTGQELKDAINSELDVLENKFSEWLKEDLIDFAINSEN